MLDKQFELLLKEVKSSDAFNLTPLPKKPIQAGKAWFTKIYVSRNCFSTMLKEMCKLAKNFTNHLMRSM